ncbi:MAG: Carboxylesterase (Est-3) [Archaeoglobus fulgidus]|uniref:Carboxylesterase (Est-3) n=1 Tax=Archaeoglobus fulgidus TaxID=2234 RepID=A0A101E007_ARCFL|nr:alpha/beta hydrolase [Archaeoglobus fulgidus]KUJ94719.1 MAG: Carboxylesterase (Est-3) [Archaeoglobus fulgidus]KUK06239.1 MAG: Carboxylesterase (Est-3) [Archaeoglobus fulgidus]
MERITLEIDALKISVLKGKEKDVMYIHGSGCDATLWERQLEDVGGYAIDLPNHGRSCAAEIRDIGDYAYFVAKAVKKLMGKAVIVGHSLGGAVAQKIYLEYPKVVKALVLVGTGARLRVMPEILTMLKEKPAEAAELVSKYAFSNQELAKEFSKVFAERAGVLHLDLSLCDRFDLLEDYRSGKVKVDIPTLLIVGEKDALTPVKYSEFFKKHIPSAEMVVIPEAGHMVMLEKPDEFNRALKNFIEKL